MKKNKKKQSLLIIALVAVVGIMSVAFALNATTTLTATGTVGVPYVNWDVEFVNVPDVGNPFQQYLDGEETSGYVSNVVLAANGQQGANTAITYDVTFDEKDFGKTIHVAFPIVNKGNLDAVVSQTTTLGEGASGVISASGSIVEDLDDVEDWDNLVSVATLDQEDGALLVVALKLPTAENIVGNKVIGAEGTKFTVTTTLEATYTSDTESSA